MFLFRVCCWMLFLRISPADRGAVLRNLVFTSSLEKQSLTKKKKKMQKVEKADFKKSVGMSTCILKMEAKC